MQIGFNEENATGSSLGHGGGKVQSYGGFPVLRQSTGDDQGAKFGESGKFPQSHSEKAETVGTRPAWICQQHNALHRCRIYKFHARIFELAKWLNRSVGPRARKGHWAIGVLAGGQILRQI